MTTRAKKDYSQGKIYKIEPTVEHDEGDIYIGSTTKKYLCQRLAKHKYDYKYWIEGKRQSKTTSFILFEKYGIENCEIVLLENIVASNFDELSSRETHYIKYLKCVNKVIPTQTTAEWYETNKEVIREKRKQYYEMNKHKINLKHKQYKTENKDKIEDYIKKYKQQNKDKIIEQRHNYYDNNKDILLEKSRNHYNENQEKINERHKKYHQDNKEKLNEQRRQRYLKQKQEKESLGNV